MVFLSLPLRALAVRLGSSYTISISKIRGGKAIRTSKLKASYLEEIDQVVPRLVRASALEQNLVESTRLGEVTESEIISGGRRQEASKRSLFGFGLASVSGLNSGLMYDASLGWGIDWPQFRMKATWDLGIASTGFNSFFTSIAAGGNGYFSDRSGSPYAGAEVGFGWLKAADGGLLDSIQSTPLLGLVIGYEAFRNHTATGFLQAKLDALLNISEYNSPMIFSIQAGVNY